MIGSNQADHGAQQKKKAPFTGPSLQLWVWAGRIPEVLSILRRRNTDILFERRAEMAMVVESQPLADDTDRKGCIHQKVLRFTDFAAHDIFHHGDTGFRFKYMRKVKRTNMKPRSQLMQLQRFNIVRIQILHDILNEFLCILVCDHVGLLSSMQFIIYNAQQSVRQLPQCRFMIYILPIQHIKRKQNMLHCGPVIRKI